MRPAFLAALLLACSTTTLRAAPAGAEKIVWQIGKPDHDYSEFACAGDHRAYARKFGSKPVVFEAGRSEPARDWPFIQPGPLDAGPPAAGSRGRSASPCLKSRGGVLRCAIEFADVQPSAPPRLCGDHGRPQRRVSACRRRRRRSL